MDANGFVNVQFWNLCSTFFSDSPEHAIPAPGFFNANVLHDRSQIVFLFTIFTVYHNAPSGCAG